MKEPILGMRSACSSCKRTLSFWNLIPVISYVIQGGKCRQCKKWISPFTPLTELITACLFVYAYTHIGWSFELFIAWTFISLLVIISVSDITYMLIPDKVLLVFTGIILIERLIQPLTPWWDSYLGAAVIFIILMGITVLSKGGIGGGDIKLYAVLGLALGLKLVLFSFFFANLIGAIIGVLGMAIGVVERKKPIPFGPFIAVGTLFVYFFNNHILAWYYSLFQF